jgi:hypothetical protein
MTELLPIFSAAAGSRQRRRHGAVRPRARQRAGACRRHRPGPGRRLCLRPRTRRRRLRALSYRERAAMLAATVKVLQANRDAYYEIATANSGTVKNDSAVDIDGGIYTLGTYAKLGDSLGDRKFATCWMASPRAWPRTRLPEPACAGAHARPGAVHQRLQLPELGPVGKGRARAAVRRAGGRQARHRHGLADPAHGQGRGRRRRAARGRTVHGVWQLGRPDGRAAALRRGVVHRLGRHRCGDPLAPAVAQRSVRVNIEADSVNSACCCPARPRGAKPSSCWPRKWRAR